MIRNCRHCSVEFETQKYNKLCCTVRCANLFRYRNPVNLTAAVKYRGRSHRTFLMSLRTKLQTRRDLDINLLLRLWEEQEGKCALSGRDMTYTCGNGIVQTNISIDRIDPLGPYEDGNIRLVCRQANIMKQRLSDDDLASWCKDITDTNDKRKKK